MTTSSLTDFNGGGHTTLNIALTIEMNENTSSHITSHSKIVDEYICSKIRIG